MNKGIERQITKIYQEVFKKIFTPAALQELYRDDGNIKYRTVKLQNSKLYKKFCKEFAAKLAKKGLANERGLWRYYFKAAKKAGLIGIDVKYSDYEQQIYEKAVKNNFKMIKSIPEEVFKTFKEKSVQALLEQVLNGTRGRRYFEEQLKSHGAKKAGVIARTETAKLQSIITENRATNLGSVAYIWKSSRDKRTRQSHKEMNDVVVFFRQQDEKPLRDGMRGNAGEFPNCRCTILPIFGRQNLKKNSYQVYDYRTDEIITMPTKMLLDYLINGSLD